MAGSQSALGVLFWFAGWCGLIFSGLPKIVLPSFGIDRPQGGLLRGVASSKKRPKKNGPSRGRFLLLAVWLLALVSNAQVTNPARQVVGDRAKTDDTAREADRRILVEHVVEAQRDRQRVIPDVRVIRSAQIGEHD